MRLSLIICALIGFVAARNVIIHPPENSVEAPHKSGTNECPARDWTTLTIVAPKDDKGLTLELAWCTTYKPASSGNMWNNIQASTPKTSIEFDHSEKAGGYEMNSFTVLGTDHHGNPFSLVVDYYFRANDIQYVKVFGFSWATINFNDDIGYKLAIDGVPRPHYE
ncbi:uncharacterized protein L969DRAFT_17492 [Mixia osmundae IAM 14324]|uniref:uncharacterized protein n=1 Tax=Mixia osmundae (strain CBS 9802 / IAM 14324 / JCM 22182 / KY 12970) TaxID=764103 RepID=UPI0004A55667|nr:uncharacterized protein L969DRAFT_17492 [Mixia osmundae IAM 14324]KEI39572.1 hypothetical protein L969DRAFT_17492 [Mixia osmundae IAM 14324]